MRNVTLSFVAVLLALPAVARAQLPPPTLTAAPGGGGAPFDKTNWPMVYVDRPLTRPAGMVELGIIANSNLSDNAVAKPISLPLVVHLGVTDDFQLSLSHGTGLCLAGAKNGCAKLYNDARLTGLLSFSGRGTEFEFAGWAALNFSSFDPMLLQLMLGPAINWAVANGNAAIVSYPGLTFGLNDRDGGNVKQAIELPTYLYVRSGQHASPFVYMNLSGPIEGFSDSYVIPLGFGLVYGLSPTVDLGGQFQFTRLIAAHGNGGAEGRTLYLFLNARL